MKKFFVASLILFLTINSCKTSKKITEVLPPSDDTITDQSFRKPVRSRELFATVTDVIALDTVYISNDTLHLLTNRISGCDEENFKLIWSGMMMKSMPPQTSVKLFQQADPACNESHRFLLRYNIKPLRFKEDSLYATHADSMTTNAIIIRVGGWKSILNYEFPGRKY